MKLLTADGDYAAVSTRGWPMAGLEWGPSRVSQSYQSVQLTSLASGEPRSATFYALYRSNPWIYACVQSIARGIAGLPLKVFQLLPDGNRERVRGDLPGQVGRPTAAQQLDNLLHHPAPRTSRAKLVKRTIVDKLIYGNGMWTMDRGPAGSITALWHAPWRRVDVIPGEEVPILGYELKGGKGSRFFQPDDVVHFSNDEDTDSLIGLSPLAPLRYTLALHDAIQRHVTAFFQNQARLSGHLKVDSNISARNLEATKEMMRQLYTAPENAGKVLVTSGDWQPMSAAPGQTDLIELAKASALEISAVYGVPPPLISILDKAIKSNVKELREQNLRDVIGPHAEAFEQDIEAQLLPSSPGWAYVFTEFDMAEKLRPDLTARADALEKMRHTLTLNDRRRIENLAPIDDARADAVWMPLNEIPIGPGMPWVDPQGAPEADPPAPPPEDPADEDVDDDEEDDG